jgi:glycosyltransferase involved in cell wall biosynthesis
LEIGGFDETYAYFLDETDVCLRLVDRGGILRYAPKAIIYHRFAASHLRNIRNVPKSRFMPIRSKAYFMLRHARDLFTPGEIATKVEEFRAETKRHDEWNANQGRISWAAKSHMELEIDRGIQEAHRLSQGDPRTPLGPDTLPLPFHLFPRPPSLLLRVAFISRGFPPSDTNGIARWVSLMAKGLASRGHQVHVITLAQQEPSTSYEDDIWIHRIDTKISSQLEAFIKLLPIPSDILRWSAAAYETLLAIGFHNLDIVSAPIWDVEGIVSHLLSPIPVVASLHTTYKLAETHKPDWQRPVFNKNHVQQVSFAEKFLFECSPWFLGNSDAIVNDIEDAYKIRIRERTRIVPHGVEDVDFEFESCASSYPVVLFVGRQETRKGFDTAIQSAVIVCRNNPTVKFQFIGAPCSDAKCEKSIQEIPAEFVQRIEILGYLSEEDLQAAYKKCDVFIAPSRYESFGLIAIEAMRYGKPVIVGDRGGLREVVRNEVNGFLVDPDSPEALAQSIERLLSDPGLREKFSIEARRIFLSKFTVEKMAGNAELALMDFANLQGY